MIELGVTPTLIQPVILCGGSGTRLWPLSRVHHPKPLRALNGERTLLQETGARCAGIDATVEPLVICNEAQRFMVAEQLRRIGAKPKEIVLESHARGTAPALTLAAVHSVTADDPVLLALPSDHVIVDREAFRRAVERAAALALQGHIALFGVPAASADTGFGYIRAGRALAGPADAPAHYVDGFVEKPDAAAAQSHIQSGDYYWNAGIYAVRASVWIDAIGNFRKEILGACERAYRQGWRDGAFLHVEPGAFSECPSDSIDYAVMEHIAGAPSGPEAVMVRLDAGWCDVGAWDAPGAATTASSAASASR